jgi:hypothetical protein
VELAPQHNTQPDIIFTSLYRVVRLHAEPGHEFTDFDAQAAALAIAVAGAVSSKSQGTATHKCNNQQCYHEIIHAQNPLRYF